MFDEDAADEAVVSNGAVLDHEADGGDGDAGADDADCVGDKEATAVEAKEECAEGAAVGTGAGEGDADEDGEAPFAVFLYVGAEFVLGLFEAWPDAAFEPSPAAEEEDDGAHEPEGDEADADVGEGADERDHGPAELVFDGGEKANGDGGAELEAGDEGDDDEL